MVDYKLEVLEEYADLMLDIDEYQAELEAIIQAESSIDEPDEFTE
ncbi:MAG: hypothetical protein ACOX6V_05085 [Patescibacteria group bacterium]|jgi:hypothetical protein